MSTPYSNPSKARQGIQPSPARALRHKDYRRSALPTRAEAASDPAQQALVSHTARREGSRWGRGAR
jgi:hypothetical protein